MAAVLGTRTLLGSRVHSAPLSTSRPTTGLPRPARVASVHIVAAGFSGFGKSDDAKPSRPPPRPSSSSRPSRGGPRDKRDPSAARKQEDEASGSLRLNKALADAGVASRRTADEMIAAGRVKVNGNECRELGTKVDPSKDTLHVDDKLVRVNKRHYYFAINKPKGYICSTVASDDHKSTGRLVIDLLNPWVEEWKARTREREAEGKGPRGLLPPRFFTVGRLDVNSTGLIFVTNDGDWAQQVSHPSTGITKEYIVSTDRALSDKDLDIVAAGGVIDGEFVQPVYVQPIYDDPQSRHTRRIKVVVQEGRNREVRRLVGLAGLDVKALKRVRIGGFRLPRDLNIMDFRELGENEVRRVTNLGAQKLEGGDAVEAEAEAEEENQKGGRGAGVAGLASGSGRTGKAGGPDKGGDNFERHAEEALRIGRARKAAAAAAEQRARSAGDREGRGAGTARVSQGQGETAGSVASSPKHPRLGALELSPEGGVKFSAGGLGVIDQ